MSRSILSRLLFTLGIFATGSTALRSQTSTNQEWVETTGVPDNIDWTASTMDASGNLIMVGNTLTSPGNPDVYVVVRDRNGVMLWNATFGGSYNGPDYGIAVSIDPWGNVLVAATVTTMDNAQDFLILKYSPTGTLLWDRTWNGPSNLADVPAAITADTGGDIYVAGATWVNAMATDYAVVKFNAQGDFKWEATYDYAGLIDAATGIRIDVNGHPVVTGGSATSVNDWDYATLQLDKEDGSQLQEQRVSLPGVGLDMALAMAQDANGNILITGYREVSGNKNIQTIKLNTSLGLEWVKDYDGAGAEDVGRGIGADNNGNVYVTGYTTKDGRRQIVTIKYDASGNEVWVKKHMSKGYGNAEAFRLTVSSNGTINIAGTIDHGQGFSYLVIQYDTNGKLIMESSYDGGYGSDRALNILADAAGDLYVMGISEGPNGPVYATIKYSVYRRSEDILYDQFGQPHCKANEVIVKFKPALVNTTVVDRKGWQHGDIRDVIGDSLTSIVEQTLGLQVGSGRLRAIKIHKRMTTADTISISRLGNPVRIPEFWSTFVIEIKEGMDVFDAVTALNTLPGFIDYAEVNGIGVALSLPNDPHFVAEHQAGLVPTVEYPDGSINLEGAWSIQTGQSHVKVGIYDSPLYWQHPDFGGDQTFPNDKVQGGFNYYHGTELGNVVVEYTHGTAVAGIVGALRNNNAGVAGIAGGDVDNDENKGAALYSMAIFSNNLLASMDIVSAAMVEGASSTGYGLHVQNHSWGTMTPYENLYEAMRFVHQNECLLVAGRGNHGTNLLTYPACMGWDEWRLSVGASNTQGERQVQQIGDQDNQFSTAFGGEMDVLAPGVTQLIATLQVPANQYNWNNCGVSGDYTCFRQTSAAGAHVSGVAALMLSEHNILNGADNDLAPEDVEFLIQRYAQDVGIAGYDEWNGWGKIDATNTIEKIKGPQYKVFHSGEPTTVSQAAGTSLTVILDYNINGLSPGSYQNSTRVQVTHTYNNVFAPSTQILDAWGRNSGTLGFNYNSNYLDGRFYGNYSISVNANTASVSVTTAAYHVGGQWIPAHPDQLRTAYSLHLYDPEATSVAEHERSVFSLYPNPANDMITIVAELNGRHPVQIEVVDVAGRIVFTEFFGHKNALRESFSIVDLAQGAYSVVLRSGEEVLQHRFIKQ